MKRKVLNRALAKELKDGPKLTQDQATKLAAGIAMRAFKEAILIIDPTWKPYRAQ